MTSIVVSGLTLAGAIGAGLMGGLFFTFSNSIMTAFGRVPAAQGIAAMQTINVTIINPLFMLVFMGTGLICLVLGANALLRFDQPGAIFVLTGAVLYLAGSIGVTMLVNVPLNNTLAALDPEAPQSASFWARYLREWTAWNHVRALACTASMAALATGLRWPVA